MSRASEEAHDKVAHLKALRAGFMDELEEMLASHFKENLAGVPMDHRTKHLELMLCYAKVHANRFAIENLGGVV